MKDDALSPVVGFILIIQILIIFLSLVQTVFIPDQLKKIEADNVEKLKGEVEKFSALAASGERAYMLVTLPDYPEYLFLLTPEPAGSSIYAEEFNITLRYTEVLPNGSKIEVLKNLKSSRVYIGVENYYYPDTIFIFENGAVFQKQNGAIIAVGEQTLINSEIKLIILKGNFSLAYNTPKEIAFQPVSAGGFVYGENISITFESVNPDFWRKYGSVSGNTVTINASSGIIRIAVYAFEGERVERKPYRLLKLNPFDSYTISKGEVKEFGVLLLDRFNNPVVGESVNISVSGGIGTVDGLQSITKVTDSAGRVYASFKATNSGEGEVIFEVGNLRASYSIKVLSPQVSGASLINVEWLNKAALEASPWDAYLEGKKVLSAKVYDQESQPIPNIDVRFVATNTSVVELNATVATTNSSGVASIEAYPLANGTTKIYAFAGDAGDVLNLTITNVTWKYRLPIYIEELSGNDLTDYQILVELTATNFNWSHINDDCSDIRFATEEGVRLNYWIETCDYENRAKIWVKVPLIPANENITIYMYYGNPSAPSKSNGFRTFVFFDDFDDGDISDWNARYATITTTVWDNKKVLKLKPWSSRLGGSNYQHFAVPSNLDINLDVYVVGAYIYDENPAGSVLFHYVDDGNWWSLELYYGGNRDIFRPYINWIDEGWVYSKTPCSITPD
ncbi:DUF2341 domain-containing protein, partial [Ferroglobus sp.]|uniref:DUF2341 domain-containing protein n=1 Tax=Ferroglobus sp. TaxID=2614230 RepID=UPI0025B9F965